MVDHNESRSSHATAEACLGEDGQQKLRVCSFESRRAEEVRSLIERHGGIATVAPSMQEVPLEDNPQAFAFGKALLSSDVDVVIFMTGVGARTLLNVLETRYNRTDLFAALHRCRIVVRGPKPAAVLREWNVGIDHRVGEPNTWRELLALIDAEIPVAGQTIAVQEYGVPNEDFYRELEQRGARVMRVPVYRWALPDDTAPLRAALHSTVAGEFDVLMFTSANQLNHVLQVAESEGLHDAWLIAVRRCVVASIGPTCSEALRSAGLPVDVETSPPKMGHLVRQTFSSAGQILQAKRSEPSR